MDLERFIIAMRGSSSNTLARSRWLVLLLVLVLATWMGVLPVQAHALLLRSIPDANATLAQSPAQVELFFNEAVEPSLSKISVLDIHKRRVDAGDTQVNPFDPTQLFVSLPPVGDGVYSVSWTVISAADGHQTIGSFPFTVGQVEAGALAGAQRGAQAEYEQFPLGQLIPKVLLYLAAALLMGVVLFTFLVWNPSLRQAGGNSDVLSAYPASSRKLALFAMLLLGVVDVLGLLAQAGQVNGALISFPWQPTFITLLLNTRIGVLGIARLAVAIALAGLLLPPPNRWNRWAGLVVCLLLMSTFSLQSHAAAEPRPLLPILADWIHMAAVSIWVGGLFSFLLSMQILHSLAPEPRTRLASFLIPHFSNLAMTSVAVLTLTGVYSAYLRIGTLEALFNTVYGRALLVKLVIALPMLALGAVNFLITTPAMRRAAAQPGGSPETVARFRNLLFAEVFLAVLLLAWVGVFTSLPPARAASSLAGSTATTQADDLSVMLNVNPGRSGLNTFTAFLTSNEKPVADAQDVSIEFNSLSMEMPASKAHLANQGDGKYSLTGGYLSMSDLWDVKVVVIRPGKFDVYADYKMDLTSVSAAPQQLPWRAAAAALIVATAICYAFSWKVLDRNLWRWVAFGLAPAWAVSILALAAYLAAAPPA